MATKKSKKASGGRGAGSGGALSRATLEDLHAELDRRRRVATSLERKRTELMSALEEVEAELKRLGHSEAASTAGGSRKRGVAPVVKRRGPRGGNSKTLLAHLEEVLEGQVLSVSEAADAVIEGGYSTTSKTFRTIVNQTLLANDSFEKVAHGRYTKSSK